LVGGLRARSAVLIGWAAKIGEADAAPIGEFCVFGFSLPCMI
jgi:hypothetical protein